MPVILWFRQDLRLTDNPALRAACETGSLVLPVYILDDENAAAWKMGGASRWWLHRSLYALNASLNNRLGLFRGDAAAVLRRLVEETGAEQVFWNRCYEPWRIARDGRIKVLLRDQGVAAHSFSGSLLFEPHATLKSDGTPYRVFTVFFKSCRQKDLLRPMPVPNRIPFARAPDSLDLAELRLLPEKHWYDGFEECWTPGEQGAKHRLRDFLGTRLRGYAEGRDRPDRENVSRLSPHLHFGEISPHAVWHETSRYMAAHGIEHDGEKFLSELGWREFSSHLLYHFPGLPERNLQPKFDRFPWRDDRASLRVWQKGETGFPIVDAGMRQLWRTGWMHNRVRMIAASFLIKNLLIDWREGARWFWDTLADADLANNSASWQWVAGSGADAAPYFRIFNPVSQGRKFDPGGDYVRRFVPELARMPEKYIHAPWEAPQDVLTKAAVELGKSYPLPMVSLQETRERALEAFAGL